MIFKKQFCLAAVMLAGTIALFIAPAAAQRRHTPPEPHVVKIKPDILTLRYKPQAGTLLYDVHTQIDQHIRTDRDELRGFLSSSAQLAFHNISIDYKKGLWSFEQYFTKFEVAGHELSGDSLLLHENMAVNRITQLTYDMRGQELAKTIKDTLKLLNAEAQTNAYFFEPPRMLIPLPEKSVTYGTSWSEHGLDTIYVRDTVNIGVTTGRYVYDVTHMYSFAKLLDTENQYFAMIVATDTGSFQGYQSNSVTNVSTKTSGPISGRDTTLLDLFSGRVVKRMLDMRIPARVEVSSATPFMDLLEVHSSVVLNESNAAQLPTDRQVPDEKKDQPATEAKP